jgi:aminoglycoside 3-N-acetyltransferase
MWRDELLAAGEIAGRRAAEWFPAVRGYARKRVRDTGSDESPVDLDELRDTLLELGLKPGSDLLIHSAVMSLRRVTAKLPELIEFLMRLAGPEGTLLMPTHPVCKVGPDGIPVYDVARSPSSVGMLTERFRRMPGTLRSPFPVAPAAALGPRAAEYTRDFASESGGTPYGQGSPYHILSQVGGQAIFIGIDFIRAITMEHVAFDLLQGDHPVPDYYVEKTFRVIDGDREEVYDVRHQRKELEPRLASIAFRGMILRSGTTRAMRLKGIPLAVLDAGPFVDWHRPLARHRGWPYWYATRRGNREGKTS